MSPVISNKKLTVNELKKIREDILVIYDECSKNARKAFNSDQLTKSQFDDIDDELIKLKGCSSKILALIMQMELNALLDTDTDSPATKIGIATKKLQEASQKIKNFLDFLTSIAEVIRIASGLIIAIQTGTIAKI